MGSCTRRHFMLSTCLLQMITIIERQVFDFLGYMWAPILVNFFHIIFIILGFYGAYHFRIKYIITYLVWSFIWIGWNAFLICFYLNVGILDRDSDLLNLGTGSVSWFEVNGYGCKPTYPVNITSDDPFRPIRPERVDDCLLDYTIVEVVQSGVQCALALLGILGAILISYIFLDEDDRFDFVNGDAKSPQHTVVHPMYVSYSSIPTSASASATLLSNKHHNNHQALNNNNNHHQIHPQQQQLQLQQQLSHHQQPNNFNSNTFLIHTNSISNNSHSRSHSHSHNHSQSQSNNSRSRSHSNSQSAGVGGGVIVGNVAARKGRGGGGVGVGSGGGGDGNSNSLSASKTSTLTRILYSPKSSNKIGSSTGNTILPVDMLQRQQSLPQTHTVTSLGGGGQHYYDDSTAKADQLYTNSNRRQFLNGTTYQQQQQHQQQQNAGTPNSSTHDNTTSSLSYASLQNSNLNLTQSLRGGPGGGFGYTGTGRGSVGGVGGGDGMCVGGVGSSSAGFGRSGGGGMTTASSQATLSPLSNSQFSLSNSINNNYSNHSGSNANNNNTNSNNVLNNHTNYVNNNNGSMGSGVGGGHFARIHAKPKPPKSTSYSSFINNGGAANLTNGVGVGGGGSGGGSMTNIHRPDIKYTQMSNERLSRNLEEGLEDDNFSLQNFKTDDGITYVPFQKPTPGALFVAQNNNPSYVSLNSFAGTQMSPNNNGSPNTINNNALPQFARTISQLAPPPPQPPPALQEGEILLERGAILQPAYNYQPHSQQQQMLMQSQAAHQPQPQPLLNPANRFLYQQNGLPFHPAYNKPIPVPPPVPTHTSPPMSAPYHHHMSPVGKQPPRPTNIPLPTIPPHSFDTPISPSDVTPPPPPAPRPHIFQPRSGHAPYPDLSPEVTEKYAMPTQYVPRSPVASRIARRQRQQQQMSHNYHHHQPAQPATHHVNTSANFCDQVRDAPPGYIVDAGFGIVRAKSYDRLASSSSGSVRRDAKGELQSKQAQVNAEAAPHVNRRSGRRDVAARARPRSYCNSMSGGEGVIRGSLVYERDFVAESAAGSSAGGVGGSGAGEGGGHFVGGDQLA